jgi:hypothetical protein
VFQSPGTQHYTGHKSFNEVNGAVSSIRSGVRKVQALQNGAKSAVDIGAIKELQSTPRADLSRSKFVSQVVHLFLPLDRLLQSSKISYLGQY